MVAFSFRFVYTVIGGNMLPQNKKLKPLAKKLRNNATRHENKLWYGYLRSYAYQFNRQAIIMDYIADFYCAKARLVIELDGSQHYTEEGLSRDLARDRVIKSLGIEVLRVSNLDIDQSLAAVCDKIDQMVRSRIS